MLSAAILLAAYVTLATIEVLFVVRQVRRCTMEIGADHLYDLLYTRILGILQYIGCSYHIRLYRSQRTPDRANHDSLYHLIVWLLLIEHKPHGFHPVASKDPIYLELRVPLLSSF